MRPLEFLISVKSTKTQRIVRSVVYGVVLQALLFFITVASRSEAMMHRLLWNMWWPGYFMSAFLDSFSPGDAMHPNPDALQNLTSSIFFGIVFGSLLGVAVYSALFYGALRWRGAGNLDEDEGLSSEVDLPHRPWWQDRRG